MKIVIGSDKSGFPLKEHLKGYLKEKGYEVLDKTPKAVLDFVDSKKKLTENI